MEELSIINTIYIRASRQAVWDALTRPEMTKQYMFGCETVSDWKQGSELLWKMLYEGKDFIAVKGTISEIRPPELLTYTVIDPHSDIEDIPENYLQVTYELKTENDMTILTVTQGDYNKVADGEKRFKEAWNNGEGWNPILLQIKSLIETGSLTQ